MNDRFVSEAAAIGGQSAETHFRHRCHDSGVLNEDQREITDFVGDTVCQIRNGIGVGAPQ